MGQSVSVNIVDKVGNSVSYNNQAFLEEKCSIRINANVVKTYVKLFKSHVLILCSE